MITYFPGWIFDLRSHWYRITSDSKSGPFMLSNHKLLAFSSDKKNQKKQWDGTEVVVFFYLFYFPVFIPFVFLHLFFSSVLSSYSPYCCFSAVLPPTPPSPDCEYQLFPLTLLSDSEFIHLKRSKLCLLKPKYLKNSCCVQLHNLTTGWKHDT